MAKLMPTLRPSRKSGRRMSFSMRYVSRNAVKLSITTTICGTPPRPASSREANELTPSPAKRRFLSATSWLSMRKRFLTFSSSSGSTTPPTWSSPS